MTTKRQLVATFHRLSITLSPSTKEGLKRFDLDDIVPVEYISERTHEIFKDRFLQEFKGEETDRNFLGRVIANIRL